MIKFILNLFISKTVYEQEEDYIRNNGYPDETVVFTDTMGRMSQLVGRNTFLKVINSDWSKQISKEIEIRRGKKVLKNS